MTDLTFNGTEVESVNFNGTDCNNVYFNGVKVWTKSSNLVAGRFFESIYIGGQPPLDFLNFTYVGYSGEHSGSTPPLQAVGTLEPRPIPNLVQTGVPATNVISLLTERIQLSSTISFKLIAHGWDAAETVVLNPVSVTGVFEGGGAARTIVLNFGARTTDAADIATWALGGFSSDDQMVLGNSYIVSAG